MRAITRVNKIQAISMHYVVRDAHLNKCPNCRILKLNSSTDYSNDAKNS